MSIGKQIKVARTLKGISAKALAEIINVQATYLSKVENDRAPGMTVDVFLRICRALDVEPNVILEWDQGRNIRDE